MDVSVKDGRGFDKKGLFCMGICFTILLAGCSHESKETEEVPTQTPVVTATAAATAKSKEETERKEIVHYKKLGKKTTFRKWKFTIKNVKEKSAINIKNMVQLMRLLMRVQSMSVLPYLLRIPERQQIIFCQQLT